MPHTSRRRLIYIVSSVNRARYFEGLTPYLESHGYELEYLILSAAETHLERHLRFTGAAVRRITFTHNRQLPMAAWKIYRTLRSTPHYAVHTHLFEASVAGMVAARLAGSRRRICTRWHSNLHKVFHPHAVKYDRLCNRLATHIITASAGTKEFLVREEEVDEGKVFRNEIGFDCSLFDNISDERIEAVRKKYNPARHSPCIGVVARQTEWKGVHFVVEAFVRLRKRFPNAHLILANTAGDYRDVIRLGLGKLPPSSYTEIDFEDDILALYRIFDIFAHTPVDKYSEAGGQVYIEAMMSGIPSVITLSGVVLDFAENMKHCLIVDYGDPVQLCDAFQELIEKPELAEGVAKHGQSYVRRFFRAEVKRRELCDFYDSLD